MKNTKEITRKCTELKKGDIVLFYVDPYSLGQKESEQGTVINVYEQKVDVCYLYGCKSMTDMIPFEDMVSVHDKNGAYQKFYNFSGTGFYLEPRYSTKGMV